MRGKWSPRHAAVLLAAIVPGLRIRVEGAPEPAVFSHYVAAEDGTRLAADVYLPAGAGHPSEAADPPAADADARYPSLLTLTRYRRGLEDPETGERINTLSGLDRHFLTTATRWSRSTRAAAAPRSARGPWSTGARRSSTPTTWWTGS